MREDWVVYEEKANLVPLESRQWISMLGLALAKCQWNPVVPLACRQCS
jgi:hypothetical protein